MAKPVILLAFANESPDQGRHLRLLSDELNALKRIYEQAEDDGLCELEILPNATLDNLIAAFQRPRYRDRIAVFHYGGHADSYELLLEEAAGATRAAYGEGLVPFLAGQKGLKLIFLNGCLSAQQAQDLVRQGIPAVIGTVQSVSDQIATELAVAFHRGLCKGLAMKQSWEEAVFRIQSREGTRDLNAYYAQRGIRTPEKQIRFPWELYLREGEALVQNWNLPDAVEDPYFGLPGIPSRYELSATPYHFLQRYRRKDARTFFGRGSYVRDLYYRITTSSSAPVIMLYGQSGVGKSSLLEAGLFPRLEEAYEIRYLRRDPEKGLLRHLQEALSLRPPNQEEASPATILLGERIDRIIGQFEGILPEAEGPVRHTLENLLRDLHRRKAEISSPASTDLDLRDQWKRLEKNSDKKGLVIILDQVEEVFTRPSSQPEELTDFLEALQALFSDPEQRPAGRLLLCYRKEYDSEIEKAFREYALPKEKVFLEKLNRKEVVEIVNGLTSTPALQKQYRLEVEPALPGLIADNLLMDKDSPVAPVLQITLTKLWQRQEDMDQRLFRVGDYQQLREEGIFLDDFFQQQMNSIKAWEQEVKRAVESSGLALDILNYHTTDLGTAESRKLEELRKKYEHQSDILETLIRRFKELYLLTDIGRTRTGLAHDTLAPIVQKQIKDSDKPGQRALRILSTKATEYERSPATTYIDEEDLALVERGAAGMRIWTTKEQELVEKSRERRSRRQARRRRERNLKIGGVLLITLLAIIATTLWQRSVKEERAASLISLGQQLAQTDASSALDSINRALVIRPHNVLALQARQDIYHDNEFYELSIPNQAKSNPGASGYLSPFLNVDYSPNDSLILATDGSIRIYHEAGQLVRTLTEETVEKAVFSPDGRQILAAGSEKLILFDLEGNKLRELSGHRGTILDFTFSPDGKKVLSGASDSLVIEWDLESPSLNYTVFRSHQQDVTAVAYDPLGDFKLSADRDGTVYKWASTGEPPQQVFLFDAAVLDLAVSANPMSYYAVVAKRDGKPALIDLTFDEVIPIEARAHELRINSVAVTADGRHFLTAGDDKKIVLWNIEDRRPLRTYRGHNGYVHDVSFLRKNQYFLSASEDGTVKRWKVASKIVRSFGPFPGAVSSVAFSPNEEELLIGTTSQAGEFDINAAAASPDDFFSFFDEPDPGIAYHYDRRGRLIDSLTGHKAGITTLAFTADGELRLSASDDGQVILWGPDGQAAHQLNGHRSAVFTATLSPDDRMILTGGSDSLAILWSAEGERLATLPHPATVSTAGFARTGGQLITGCYDGQVRLWSNAGELLRVLATVEGTIEKISVSPDGEYLAIGEGGAASRLQVWNLREEKRLLYRELFEGDVTGGKAIYSVAFSPDSRLIAAGGEGGRLRVFNLEGLLIQSLEEFEGSAINSIVFSPDGRYLLTGSGDGWARIFENIAFSAP